MDMVICLSGALLAVIVSSAEGAGPDNAERHYQVTDLGVLTYFDASFAGESYADAINDLGEVVGDAGTGADVFPQEERPFLFTGGRLHDICAAGCAAGRANDVNEAGQVIGEVSLPDDHFSWRPYVYQDGDLRFLDELVSDSVDLRFASGINSSGHIAGAGRIDAQLQAVLLSNDYRAVTWLGTLGGTTSRAWAINDLGHVVGSAETAAGASHAFLWRDGEMMDLGTLGGESSSAEDINNDDVVVGWAQVPSGERQAFVWRDGEMTDLGTGAGYAQSKARAVNDRGQIVGSTLTGAVLWENGTATNLTDCISWPGSWELDSASGINNAGQIAGSGYRLWGRFQEVGRRAFLLTPIDAEAEAGRQVETVPSGTNSTSLCGAGILAALPLILLAWAGLRGGNRLAPVRAYRSGVGPV